MPYIRAEVLHRMQEAFLSCETEQGFLLGCKMLSGLELIDVCSPLPALRAGKCFYEPNPQIAEKIIREWASKEICFHGMIHSHIVPKKELSEDDKAYASALTQAYQLPIFWFGLGVRKREKVDFYFWRAEKGLIREEIVVVE